MKRDRLYTVNKGNQPIFKNLFSLGSEMQYGVARDQIPGYISISDLYSNPNFNNNVNLAKLQVPNFTYNNTPSVGSIGTGNASNGVNWFNKGLGIFGQGQSNLARFDRLASAKYGASYGDPGKTLSDYMNSENSFGISKANNPFSKGNIGSTAGALAPLGMAIGANDKYKRGLFDRLDPMHHLAGGRESAVGNAIGDLGVGVFQAGAQSGNGLAMLGGAALKVIGGGYNALLGMKEDKEQTARNKEGTALMNNYTSTASDYDNVVLPQAVAAYGDAFKGGLFKKKKARRLNRKARDAYFAAKNHAFGELENNLQNIGDDQMNNMLAQSYGFGGALDLMQQHNYLDAINNRSNAVAKNNIFTPASEAYRTFASGGSIHINPEHKGLFTSKANRAGMGVQAFASHVLANKEDYPTSTIRQANFAKNAAGWKHDEGGAMEMAFMDNFRKNPIASAMEYIRAQDALEAQKEAQAAAEAQEAQYADMQNRLAATEARNAGLESLLLSGMYSPRMTAPIEGVGDVSGGGEPIAPIVGVKQLLGNDPALDNYDNLKKFIKSHEGLSKKAFTLPGEAHPSIGYGFYDVYPGTNRKVKIGDTITEAEADKYLDAALKNLDKELSKKVPNWSKLSNNQRDALRDLAYATGPFGAHFKPNSKLMTALRNEDWATASKHLGAKSASLDKYNAYLAKISKGRENIFTNGRYSMKAFGGELGTNGTDFTNGLLEVNAGGTHEDNPFQGVQLGVDSQGIPNLVEEGETVYNDYVFSKRMTVPEFMHKQLGLGGSKKEMTFADASKKLAAESTERPNDPISQAGLDANLAKLAEVQEAERARIQAEKENAEMEAMQYMPDDMLAQEDLMAACGGKLHAFGGNLFDGGGALEWLQQHHPELGNKKQIAAVMEKRAKGDKKYQFYKGSNPNDIFYRYDYVYKSLAPKTNLINGSNEAFYNELVKDGMDKKVAFGLAFPQELSYPYKGDSYRKQNDKVRKDYYNKLIVGNGKNSKTEGNIKAEPVYDWNNLQAPTPFVPNNGITVPFRSGTQSVTPKQQPAVPKQQASTANTTKTGAPKQASTNSGSTTTRQRTAATNAPGTNNRNRAGKVVKYSYDRYLDGSDGYSTPTGFKVDSTGRASDYTQEYLDLVNKSTADDIRNWARERGWSENGYELDKITDPSLRSFLAKGNKLEDLTDEQWREGATDGWFGFMHHVGEQKLKSNNPQAPAASPVQPSATPAAPAVGPIASAPAYSKEAQLSYWGPGVGNKSWLEAASETGFGGTNTNYETAVAPIYVPANQDVEAVKTQVPYAIGQGPTTTSTTTAKQEQKSTGEDVEFNPPTYPTWMRYAPVVGSAISAATDLLGLTNKPDYTYADKLEAMANRAGYSPNVRPMFIGDYERYSPFDRLFYTNQLQANSRATDRNLMNTSGGNQGAARASMLANGYQGQLALGNLYRQAEEYNRGQYERVKDFNRKTNMFNSQMGLEAAMANARYQQQARQYQLSGLAQAAAMRDAIDARVGAARSANLTNLFNNLGAIGAENFALNQINWDRSRRHGAKWDGTSYDKIAEANGYIGAFGGEVERYKKNKKQGRRR